MGETINFVWEVAMEKELYWKMYAVLCGSVSDAIEALEDPKNSLYAQSLLKQAILQAEELYISHGEDAQ